MHNDSNKGSTDPKVSQPHSSDTNSSTWNAYEIMKLYVILTSPTDAVALMLFDWSVHSSSDMDEFDWLWVLFTMTTRATLRFTRIQYTLINPQNDIRARIWRFPKPVDEEILLQWNTKGNFYFEGHKFKIEIILCNYKQYSLVLCIAPSSLIIAKLKNKNVGLKCDAQKYEDRLYPKEGVINPKKLNLNENEKVWFSQTLLSK